MCLGEDFEFIKCANRRVPVPDGNISFDGETLKSLYKGGSVCEANRVFFNM